MVRQREGRRWWASAQARARACWYPTEARRRQRCGGPAVHRHTGVGGGYVVLAADDPGMYSSQNNRTPHYYAAAAPIPMMDPADSAEALAFTRDAFDLSERFKTCRSSSVPPCACPTKTPVEHGPRTEHELKPPIKATLLNGS